MWHTLNVERSRSRWTQRTDRAKRQRIPRSHRKQKARRLSAPAIRWATQLVYRSIPFHLDLVHEKAKKIAATLCPPATFPASMVADSYLINLLTF